MRTAVRNKLAFLGVIAAWAWVWAATAPSPAWGQSAWPRPPAAAAGTGVGDNAVRPLQQPPAPGTPALPSPSPSPSASGPAVLGSAVPPAGPRSRSILDGEVNSIDLGTALRLAGVQNPEVLIARQRAGGGQ